MNHAHKVFTPYTDCGICPMFQADGRLEFEERAPRQIRHETKIDQFVPTIYDGVAKTPQGGSARELAACFEIGTQGGRSSARDAGPGPDSRASSHHSGIVPQQEWIH